MRRAISALIAGPVLAMAAAGPAGAGAAGPSVQGGGSGPLDQDRVGITISARGEGTDATGRFTVEHHTPDGLFAHLAGDVDCLSVSGSTAVVTGTIRNGFDGLGVDPVGERVSFRVTSGSGNEVGLDVSFFSGHAIEPCTADPVVVLTIGRGTFTIR